MAKHEMLLCQHLRHLSVPSKNNMKLLSTTDIQYDNIPDDNLVWIADLETPNCVGESKNWKEMISF